MTKAPTMTVTPGSTEVLALADEIETSDGLYRMSKLGKYHGYHLGIKKTAQIVTALRLAAKSDEGVREAQIKLLAHFYNRSNEYVEVARICDKELDRSGALLGEVRTAARRALSTGEPKR